MRIDRIAIADKARVFDADLAEARKKRAVAGISRRHHAVEHIHAASDIFDEILGRTDPHQISRARRIDVWHHGLYGFVHQLVFLAHAKPSDRKPVKAHLAQRFGAKFARLRIGAALDDTEDVLMSVQAARFHGLVIIYRLASPFYRAHDA